MTKAYDFDVIIVGGGMVGASLACALATLPLKIAIIEAFPFRSDNQPSYDARSIALAYGSKRIFDTLGIWQNLETNATPIEHIHISNKGQFGVTRLSAKEESLNALGYVIENRVLGNALLKKIEHYSNIELICPAKLAALKIHTDVATLRLEKGEDTRQLTCKLVVGADGGNSKVREILGIKAKTKDYQQTAIISNVSPGKAHHNIAYERFTKQGPIAILPMTENRCSLVLTVEKSQQEKVLSLDDARFLAYLEQRFGFRCGGFTKTSKRHAYPLSLMQISEHFKSRAVIIGNAAHTVHPIAGQGFNLGIRDVSVLADVIENACQQASDIGDSCVLKEYAAQRSTDQKTVAFITNSLAEIFSNDLFPLAQSRAKGLLITDLLPPLKHLVAKNAMGLSGKLPRLSRGVAL
ncbi:MAG TPA: 2-octaprenyl-6-methoxyphenyl hydroxylase [Gammaproteobacteria bacterium]|nr:2-octaprenyl-6-methoxyphenyl hydroxylase [Gammaproteobacteria bacterium]